MKTRRLIALLLMVAMLVALACGCGGKKEEPTEPAEPSAPAEPTAPAEPAEPDTPAEPAEPKDPFEVTLPICEEETFITIYSYDRPFLWDHMDNYDENTIQAELIKRTNVHPDFHWFTNVEALQVNIASGEYYDIYWQIENFYAGGLSKAFEDEVIIDVYDLVTTYMPNYYKALEDDGLALKATLDSNGHMFYIHEMTAFDYGANAGAIVREDMLQEIGWTAYDIVTYDDIHEVLTLMKTQLGVKSPIYMFSNGTPSNNYLASGFDTSGDISNWDNSMPFYKDGNTIKFAGVDDNFLEYITMIREWYAEGLFDSDFLSHQDTMRPDGDTIWGGDVGFFFWNNEVFGELIQNGSAFDPDYDVRGVQMPVKEKDQVLTFTNGKLWSLLQSFGAAISTDCDPELAVIACKWMDYAYTEEGTLLCNYGVEGLSFEYVDGKPMLKEDFLTDNYLVGDAGLMMVKNACLGTSSVYKQDKTIYDPFDNPAAIESREIYARNLVETYEESSDILTFVKIAYENSTEFNNIMNEVLNTLSEFMTAYIMGERDASEWDSIVQAQWDLGLQQCIDWYQEAFDEFMSR